MYHSAALAGDGLSGGRLHTAEGGMPTLPRWRAGRSAPEVSWGVIYNSNGVLRRGSMVACVVAYCVVHELGKPEADRLLNVQQNVRGFFVLPFVCLTHPVASAAEPSLMRERVKQTLGDGLVARHKGHGGEAERGEGKRGPKA